MHLMHVQVYKPTSYLSLTKAGINIDISFSNLELYTNIHLSHKNVCAIHPDSILFHK